MSSLNQVTLIGNLGADPEVRSFQNGGQVANLRIATSETWKDRDGQRQEKTEWHSVSVFSEGLIGVIERYLRKGSKVMVQGKLQTRKWKDRDGSDRYSTEVVLQGFEAKLVMLDSPDSGSGRGGGRGGRDDRDDDRGSRGRGRDDDRSRGRDDDRVTRNRDNRDGWGDDDRGGRGNSRGGGRSGGGWGDDDRGTKDDRGRKDDGRQGQFDDDLDDEIPF
jgi:single-strand DNA-binding protein